MFELLRKRERVFRGWLFFGDEEEKGNLFLWILGQRCSLAVPCESPAVAGAWKSSSGAGDGLCGAGATRGDSARPRFPRHGSAGKSLPAAAEGSARFGHACSSGPLHKINPQPPFPTWPAVWLSSPAILQLAPWPLLAGEAAGGMLSWGRGAGAWALTPSARLELSKEQFHRHIPNPATVDIAGRCQKCPSAVAQGREKRRRLRRAASGCRAAAAAGEPANSRCCLLFAPLPAGFLLRRDPPQRDPGWSRACCRAQPHAHS